MTARNRPWAAVCLGMMLAGCGGGGGGGGGGTSTPPGNSGSSATATGYLVDAPVYGVSYMTSSGLAGTTGVDGSFSYRAGDTVDFSALGVSLGQAAGRGAFAVPASGIVTPFVIAGETPSASSVAAPRSAAIAAFLQTLSNIAAGSASANAAGASLLMPSGSQAASLQATFAQQSAASGSTLIETLANGLATRLGPADAAYVVAPSAALPVAYGFALASGNSQTSAGSAYAGTVWKLSACSTSTSGCAFYAVLLPDGMVAGVNVEKDSRFGGYWNATAAGLTLHFQGAAGTADASLAPGATAGQATITSTADGTSGTATLTRLASAQGQATMTNSGLWYANYTPASTAGGGPGQGLFVLAPDGTLAGITDGSSTLSGTWSGTTATLTPSGGTAKTCTLDLAAMTGTCTSAGQTVGSLTLSRSWMPGPVYMGMPSSGTGSGTGGTTLTGTWQLQCPQCQSGGTTGGSSSGTYSAVLGPNGALSLAFTTTAGAGAMAGQPPSFSGTVGSSGAFTLTASAGTDCASNLVFTLYGQLSGSTLSFSVSRPQGATANGSGICEAEYGGSGSGGGGGTGGSGSGSGGTGSGTSSTGSYTIGGQASFGTSGNCVALSLTDTTLQSGNTTHIQVGPGCSQPAQFTFPSTIAANDQWVVAIPGNQPIAPYCSLANASGTATADVSNVQVTCH